MSISKSQIESILNQTKQTKELVEKAPETAKQAAALEYCDNTIALWEVALEGLAAKDAEKKSEKVADEPAKEEPLIEETATDEVDDEDWLS